MKKLNKLSIIFFTLFIILTFSIFFFIDFFYIKNIKIILYDNKNQLDVNSFFIQIEDDYLELDKNIEHAFYYKKKENDNKIDKINSWTGTKEQVLIKIKNDSLIWKKPNKNSVHFLIHNHPNNILLTSEQDKKSFKELKEILKLSEETIVFDSLVYVPDGGLYSIKEKKLIKITVKQWFFSKIYWLF